MAPKLLRSKGLVLFCLLFTLPARQEVQAQACFQIESILVDACSPGGIEGQNEVVRFTVGNTALNANNLNVGWPNSTNAWSGVCQDASTAALVAQINSTIINCGYLIEPPGGILPAGADVLLISSVDFDPQYSTFANLADTLYVIFHCGTAAAGNFANGTASGTRTLTMSFSVPAGCTESVTYDCGQLIGGDGALANFDAAGNVSYDNQGCSAPFEQVDPSWAAPQQICATGGVFDLSIFITGTPGGVWDGPNITGSLINTSGLTGFIDITYSVGVPGCVSGNTSETHAINFIPGGSASWNTPGILCESEAPVDLSPYVLGTPGGTWIGQGISGNVFNPAGLNGPISLTYAVGQSFCTSSSTDVITVVPTPVAGWTTFSICESDAPVDLNTFITGTFGGDWSGTNVSGSFFDPSGLSGPVLIRYDVSAGSCTDMLSQDVTVIDGPDASWTIPPALCHNDNPLNLNTLITGTPGGVWSGTGVNGNNFNPAGLNGLIQISYTATNPANSCSATEMQEVTVTPSSVASWTSPGTICSFDAPIDLNTLVTGTTGGTWSGTGVTGSTFDPSGLNANIPVNYSVGSGTCANSQVNFINVLSGGDPSWTTTSLCDSDAPVDLNSLVTGDPGGTWSGTGVNGNMFNPAGLAGPVSVTYSLNVGGCATSSTQNISVSAGSNASWNIPSPLCDTDAAISLDALITGNAGGSWSGQGVVGNMFSPSGLSGNITLTYSVGAGVCAASVAHDVVVNSAGNPAWTAQTLCSTDPILDLNTLVTGDAGGTWSGNGITGNNFDPAGFNGPVDVTYTLVSANCSASETNQVNVTASANASFVLPASICDNDNAIDLNTTVTGDAGGSWSGTGVNGSSLNPAGLSGLISVTYTVGSGSCAATQTEQIQVNLSGNPAFNATLLCETDASLDLNSLLTGDAGGIWSGTGVTGNMFSPAGLDGNIPITYSVGSGLCIQSQTQNIQVLSSGSASFNLPAQICEDAVLLDLNSTITGTPGGTWSGNGVLMNSFDPAGLNGLITITYSVGAGSCADSQQHDIEVLASYDASFQPATVCTADGQLDLNTLITGDAGGTWSGSGVSGTQFDPSGQSGLVTITYTIGSGACINATNENLNVISSGDASFVLPAGICEGAVLSDLNTTVTGTAGGSWSGTGVSNATFDATGLTGSISITYTAGSGTCFDTQTQSIEVYAIPIPPAADDTFYCDNVNPPLLVATGELGAQFGWFNAANPGNQLGSGSTFQVPPFSEGPYLVNQSVNGCTSDFTTVNVDLIESPLAPIPVGQGLLCDGILMQDIHVNANGVVNWYTDDIQDIPFFTGQNLSSGANLQGVQFLLLQATANGCTSPVIDFPLQDPGVLSADILGDDSLFVCMNSEDVLLQSAHNDLNVWSTGSASAQIYVYEQGTIFLTRSNACGTASDTVEVIDVSADASFFVDVPHQAFAPSYVSPQVTSAGGQNCNWFVNGDSTDVGVGGILIADDEDVYITHICVNDFGCADTVTRSVKLPLPAELYVPNSFTPNGDGINDEWKPIGSRIKDLNIQIFNRWGEMIATISDPLGGWDGTTISGAAAQDGVYSYKLKARDLNLKDYEYYGAIFLIR